MTSLTLSPDMFYPECSECGTGLFVAGTPVHADTLVCERCGVRWYDAEFEQVFKLSAAEKRVYVLHRHGGYAFDELARGYSGPVEVEQLYEAVRKKVRGRIGGPIPSDGGTNATGGSVA